MNYSTLWTHSQCITNFVCAKMSYLLFMDTANHKYYFLLYKYIMSVLPNCTSYSNFTYPNLDLFSDFDKNITNPYYFAMKGSMLFQDTNFTQANYNYNITQYFFMLADWFVIFCIFMQINVFAYKISQKYKLLPLFNKKKGHPQFVKFLNEKLFEYRIYANFLLIMSICETLQSLIQLLAWRGLPYFDIATPTLYCKPKQNSYQIQFCIVNVKDRVDKDSFCEYYKTLQNPLFRTLSDSGNPILLFAFAWFLLRYILNTGQLFFCFVLVGKNKKKQVGKPFIRHNIIKSLAYNTFIVVVEIILSVYFDYKIYYRYNGLGVTIVNLIERILFFFLLFDKYLIKNYLESKTKSKDIQINGIEWRTQIEKIQANAFNNLKNKIQYESIKKQFYRQNTIQLHAIYQENYERIAENQIFQKHFWSYVHNPEKLFSVRWNAYINYLFIITIIGFVGYFMLMIIFAKRYVEDEVKDWYVFKESEKQIIKIGCIFVLIEAVLLKMSRDIFLTNILFKQVFDKFEQNIRTLKCYEYREQL